MRGGNLPKAEFEATTGMLDEFVAIVDTKVKGTGLRRGMVRSLFQCNLWLVLDLSNVFVAAQKQHGMPTTIGYSRPDAAFSIEQVHDAARWDFGFDDPFVLKFPAALIHQTTEQRAAALEAIAAAHIQAERERAEREMNMIQINPLFGPAAYAIDPRLAFVLMPFEAELDAIYKTLIKPTVEEARFGLVCRRADDIRSTKAVIQDIWKSICEARLIIADLSHLNANVMYELGISHTLGKETVLIFQKGADDPFPFDLAHIRRIRYTNDALGGRTLVDELRGTLEAVLSSKVTA